MTERSTLALRAAEEAGRLGLDYFRRHDSLDIEVKGRQDFVSEADKALERSIRTTLGEAFPEDGIVGEEYGRTEGSSGYTWVIDPVDGTTNFINGIPAWTVVIACVHDGKTVVGIIQDPNAGETFTAVRGEGAFLNGKPLRLRSGRPLTSGTVAVGYSNRTSTEGVRNLVDALIEEGAMFFRNASGALSLAYVAAGRLLGYLEEHMNAWDCIAGQLIVEEAGGGVERQDADDMIAKGGRVVVGAPDLFPDLVRIADASFP